MDRKGSDLRLVHWEIVRSDKGYRDLYDSYESRVVETVTYFDTKTSTELKSRKRVRLNLSESDWQFYKGQLETLRNKFNLCSFLDYNDPTPKGLRLYKNAPVQVKNLLSSKDLQKLLVSINLDSPKHQLVREFSDILDKYKSCRENFYAEVPTKKKPRYPSLEKVRLLSFVFRNRKQGLPYKDILFMLKDKFGNEVYDKYFGDKHVGIEKLIEWNRSFKKMKEKCLKQRRGSI